MFMFSYGDENNKWMQNWAKHIDAMRVLPIAELRTILKEVGFADIKILKKRDLTYHVEAIK